MDIYYFVREWAAGEDGEAIGVSWNLNWEGEKAMVASKVGTYEEALEIAYLAALQRYSQGYQIYRYEYCELTEYTTISHSGILDMLAPIQARKCSHIDLEFDQVLQRPVCKTCGRSRWS